ncbi:zf-HC2 domain-containing protein [Thiomicrorhabdus sp. Milos-T2]|uniref:DsrE family protein n=1 Tax=Thiomicrorhabdus sp. Milos-T2 TaxID=90814 RepID=UPI000493D0CA|nr:zf-HC2 domain-containing protein [Thiomicrorhabdus sp. Milos-T2]
MKHSIETYHLHAYIDGELSYEEAAEVEAAIAVDLKLKEKLEELNQLKTKMSLAYTENIPKPVNSKLPNFENKHTLENKHTPWWTTSKAAAASLFLGLLIGSGALKLYMANNLADSPMMHQTVAESSQNYLVHLDSDLPEKEQKTIKQIESLLDDSDPNIRVDLISNYKGVELFDVNNPNSKELLRLVGKYPNLTLFACKRALERAKKEGRPITVLPQVKKDKPAIDAVVERLKSGWNYIKI